MLMRLLIALLLLIPLAPRAEVIVPQSRHEVQLSFAPVVRQAMPAVVNIYTNRKVVERVSPLFADPFFNRFFGSRFGGRARERVVSSLGSGVIVGEDGTLVTNYHVIKGADDIRVVLSDGREFDAEVTVRDEQFDLAVLQIKTGGEELPALPLYNSDALEVGDLVLAIGNPFGVGQTVTSGIISAVARSAANVNDFSFFIQTDAAINPGNSGGALVDMKGRLIGVPTAIYSRSGGSNGIGFAIPANMVRALLTSKTQDGRLVKPWLGAVYQSVTREVAESLGLEVARGVLISDVIDDSPAEEAGLHSGDIIIAVGGKPVDDIQALRFRTAVAEIGKPVAITYLRRHRERETEAALIAPPEIPKRDVRLLKGNTPLSGLEVANINPALAVEFGIAETQGGVIVLKGKRGLFGGSFRKGDIIEAVNGKEITSTKQLSRMMNDRISGWVIQINRGGQVLNMKVIQ